MRGVMGRAGQAGRCVCAAPRPASDHALHAGGQWAHHDPGSSGHARQAGTHSGSA
jgi:hypothetical protein